MARVVVEDSSEKPGHPSYPERTRGEPPCVEAGRKDVTFVSTEISEGQGVLFYAYDFLDEGDFLRVFRKHFDTPADRFSGYRYTISDFTEVASTNLSASAIRKMSDWAAGAAANNADAVVCIIASSDVTFGLSRMEHSLVEDTGWLQREFRERADGVAWLAGKVLDTHGLTLPFDLAEYLALLKMIRQNVA